MTEPNDVIIRVTRLDDGSYSYDTAIGVSDDSMLPELERLAFIINNVMELYKKSDAELVYAEAIKFANGLGVNKSIVIPESEIITEH